MWRYFIALFVLVLSYGCGNNTASTSEGEQSVTVASAANIQFAMPDIIEAFEAATGIKVKHSSASSGALTAQIKNGAPFDVFLAANMKYPNALYKDGFSEKAPEVYARGTLVLWSLKPFDLQQGLSLLTTDSIARVAVANPDNAPYGIAAIEALKATNTYTAVEDKIVYGESISQVNQYVSIQSVDVGLTSKSVVLSPKLQAKGHWEEVDGSLHAPIEQGIIVLKHGAENNHENAQKFYTFLFSEKAQQILTKYGYSVN